MYTVGFLKYPRYKVAPRTGAQFRSKKIAAPPLPLFGPPFRSIPIPRDGGIGCRRDVDTHIKPITTLASARR